MRKPAPDAESRVLEIYRELDARPVERQCALRTECCHFAITGRTPYLTRGEALVAARALKASGRRALPARPDGACPLLAEESGRCMVYDGRPFGCRTHFCRAAGGPYPREKVADLIHRLEAIDRELGGREAAALPVAVEFALATLPRRKR